MENEYLNTRFFYQLENKGKRAVIDWCINMGLIGPVLLCERCGRPMTLLARNDISDGYYWWCRKERLSRSVRKGTFMEHSRLDIPRILVMTAEWVYGASHQYICQDVHMAKQTVSDWMLFCREVCIEWVLLNPQRLGGNYVVVEIDESVLCKRKLKGGVRVEGDCLFRGIERGTDNCFLIPVDECNEATLMCVLQQYVLPKTIIVSDCWKSYNCLEIEDYELFRDSQQVIFKSPPSGAQKAHKELDSYMFEGIWRRRHNDKGSSDLTKEFFKAIATIYPFNSACKQEIPQ